MPIAKWKCNICHSVVDLDHFAVSPCGLAVHPDYVAAVLCEQEPGFPDGKVRVSTASSCPRAAAIMAVEEVTVDPLAFNAMLTGTAWHKLMAKYGVFGEKKMISVDEAMANSKLVEVEVEGIIDGIPMRGHIDRLLRTASGLVIADWKHANDFARKYLKDTAKPEHIVQTSLYAELYAQQYGERPLRGVNWYHFTSSPPFVPMWYDLWPVARCLEHKPYECEFTVREILHQAADFVAGKVQWSDLPLAGESFNFSGKTGCDYCPMTDICKTQAYQAPF